MTSTPRATSLGSSVIGSGGSFNLRSWVKERFLPVVMVLSSEQAEKVCKEKNGLSFVDLLRPFGNHLSTNYPLRIGDQNVRLREFRLRFHYASTIDQPTAEVVDNYLRNVVSSTVSSELKKLPGSYEECQKVQGAEDLAPWFGQYRDEFLQLLGFDAHETFDHPLGCIFAISSAEPDPVEALERIKAGNPWPPLMAQGYMFPVQEEDFAKFIVVLHDGSVGGQAGIQSAQAKVGALQRVYGSFCELLVLNTSSGNPELQGHPPQPYESCRKPPISGGGAGRESEVPSVPPGGLGSWLSQTDLDQVQKCVNSFASRCLLPKLDVRLGKISAVLPFKRRSFAKLMDRTSTYLKMSFSATARDHATVNGFKYYTSEAQARQMGDILFVIARYEDALEAYSSVTVSREQYPKFFAGLQEMIGLCHAMIVAFGNPPVYFSKAFECYQRVPGKLCRMLAFRTLIMHAAYCNSVGQLPAANQVFMQGYEGEEMLRGALLLEQAALTLLMCRPPLPRKFAFQMTLAGVWYYNSLFKDLSLRCYEMVMGVYKGRQWVSLEEHIGDMMLRFALEQDEFESAIGWTRQMLSPNNHLTVATQKLYLQSLSDFVVSLGSDSQAQMLELEIPIVCLEELHVECDGEYIIGTNEAHEAPSCVWQHLEKCFPDPLGSTGMISISTTTVVSPPTENHQIAVCGEEIGVLCRFQNPLKLEIKVENVKLQYEYEWAEGATGANPVSVVEEKFTLKGEETAVIRLSLQVNAPGQIKVTGVEWKLNQCIPGQKRFSSTESTSSNRLPLRAKGHNPCLLFVVVPPAPRLEAVTTVLPDDLWVGEIHRGLWELKNKGLVGLKNLHVAVSSSDVLFCQMGPGQSNGDAVVEQLEVMNNSSCPTYVLEPEKEIEKGGSISCPVWLHPSLPGNQVIHCLFRYESLEPSTWLRWRYLRYSFGLKVAAPLKLMHKTKPAQGPSPSYLMMVQVGNEQGALDVQLESAASLSTGWGVSLAGSPGALVPKNSTSIGQTVPPKKRAQVPLMLTPPSKQTEIPQEESQENQENGSYASALQLLHMQRMDAAAECSTSGEDPLSLCIHWSASGSVVQGKTSQQRFSRRGVLYCTQSTKEIVRPIHMAAKGAFHIIHKFNYSPVCVVPVSLVIRNTSETSASLRVEAGSQFENSGGGWHVNITAAGKETSPDRKSHLDAGLSCAQQTTWFGQIRKSIPVLEPGGSVSVPMSVAVFRPGRYCVTDYSCQWTIEGSPAVHGVIAGPPILLSVMEE